MIGKPDWRTILTYLFKLGLKLLKLWDYFFSRLDLLQLKYYYRTKIYLEERLAESKELPPEWEEFSSWDDLK